MNVLDYKKCTEEGKLVDWTGKLKFRGGDWLAIGAVAAMIALSAWTAVSLGGGQEAGTVQIYQNGRLAHELPLSQNATVTVGGEYANVIEIRDGAVAVVQSDCPGEDCVHSGWASTAGKTIVCIPNRVEVRVLGKSEVDFVVG